MAHRARRDQRLLGLLDEHETLKLVFVCVGTLNEGRVSGRCNVEKKVLSN